MLPGNERQDVERGGKSKQNKYTHLSEVFEYCLQATE